MLRLVNAMDRLMGLQRAFDDAKKNDYFGLGTSTCGGYPHINIFKEGETSVLTAELAGVKKERSKIKKKPLLRLNDIDRQQILLNQIKSYSFIWKCQECRRKMWM